MSTAHAYPAQKPFFSVGTLVLLAVMAVGYSFGLARLLTGLGAVTNLSDNYPWGIWIAIDVACGVALAASGFTTAALAHVFGRGRYHALVRPAILSAWLGYLFVGIGLTFDLGRYWNIWRPLAHWQGNSVLFEVGLCVMAYLFVLSIEIAPSVLEGLLARTQAPGIFRSLLLKFQGPMRAIKRVVDLALPVFIVAGVVLSCMHQSSLGTLMVIAPTKLSAWWYSPFLPALFLLSAVMVGFPIVVVESLVSAKSFKREPEMELLTPLAGIIPWLIGIYGLAKLGDLAFRAPTLGLGEHPSDVVALVVELTVGVIVPFLMLIQPRLRRNARALFIACLLVIIGVVLNRINVFVVGYHPPFAQTGYFPSFGEIALTAGLVATLMFIYRFFANYFPILPAADTAGRQLAAPDLTARSTPLRIWAARGSAAVILIAFVIFYTFVHQTSEQGLVYEQVTVDRKARVWPKLPEVHHASRPQEYQNVFLINHPINNERADDYEPVRFSHRSHDSWTHGNCAACHHRMPREQGDHIGNDLVAMHKENGIQIGAACGSCHEDLNDVRPKSCDACHDRPNQDDQPDRLGLKAAYHRQCMGCHEAANSPNAPTDCNSCHHPNVPDHKELLDLKGRPTPEQVTARCQDCHADAAREVLATNHWRWQGSSFATRGSEHRVDLGKARVVDNYRIFAGGLDPSCTVCHIGYGRSEPGFDPQDPHRIDCLICHDTTGTYRKEPGLGGRPPPDLDLVGIAEKVGRPGRQNCGQCHFNACTGPNEKLGDLSPALAGNAPELDIHMGLYNLRCQDCHKTALHRITGVSLTTPANEGQGIHCTQCHGEEPHAIAGKTGFHLNRHIRHISCQTCHIPTYANGAPTQLSWDWSSAGKPAPADLPTPEGAAKPGDGSVVFSPTLGTRTYGQKLSPSYLWYNGSHERYLLGDSINPEGVRILNPPVGEKADPRAQIAPFKIHDGTQPYDLEKKILALPAWGTGGVGPEGFGPLVAKGMALAGLATSGQIGFMKTQMVSAINHEVPRGNQALGCADCHAAENVRCERCHIKAPTAEVEDLIRAHYPEGGKRLDFGALGYDGDPATVGGRFRQFPIPGVR